MKLLNLSLIAAALSLSTPVFAHDHTDLVEPQGKTPSSNISIGRAEFLGLDTQYYVKTEAGIKEAKKLVKGQKIVTQSGAPFAELTGKIVVKLTEGVSANAFAKAHSLQIDWQNDSNLVLFSTQDDSELMSLMTELKSSPQVKRAKLDRAIDKQQIQ